MNYFNVEEIEKYIKYSTTYKQLFDYDLNLWATIYGNINYSKNLLNIFENDEINKKAIETHDSVLTREGKVKQCRRLIYTKNIDVLLLIKEIKILIRNNKNVNRNKIFKNSTNFYDFINKYGLIRKCIKIKNDDMLIHETNINK